MSSEIIRQRLEEKAFTLDKESLMPNEIPPVCVWGRTLPEVWENAVLATYEFGTHIPTEYDADIDPESRDVTMMMTIAKPLEEPRIHKAIPDSFEGLATYVAEVVDGVHDYYVKKEGAHWSYSYHDRLVNYPGVLSWEELIKGEKVELPHTDQIALMIDKISKTPYTRRAQAITWFPPVDQPDPEPPCLQRVWCRLAKVDKEKYVLEMNTHWRSNDAFKAAFMNTFALTELQKVIAGEVEQKIGVEVGVGRYVGIMDSFHIYGSYIRRHELDVFMHQVETLPFEKRTINSTDQRVMRQFEKAREKLANEKSSIND
jgi:thymidylate synthase